MKITFIGAGNMAEALVAGILKKNIVGAEDIIVADISEKRLEHMRSSYNVVAMKDNGMAVEYADVVILAVKPQIFKELWASLQAQVPKDTLVISVMAGISSQHIAQDTSMRIIRVMPNTPALIGEGASGIALGEHATEDDLNIASDIMKSCGIVMQVKEELLHAVTALSGSGPAYIFYFIEAMLHTSQSQGLSEQDARELALATVRGAAALASEKSESIESLRDRVTSKGGTTAAAIAALGKHNLKEAVQSAMIAAETRSKEIEADI